MRDDIKDTVQICVMVVGAGVALIGLRTWQRQLIGTTHYELARRLLAGVYELQTEIGRFRSPFTAAAEEYEAVRAEDRLDEHKKELRDRGFSTAIGVEAVLRQRWARVVDIQSKLDVELLEARVLWPDQLSKAESSLRALRAELFEAVEAKIGSLHKSSLPFTTEHMDLLYATHSRPESDEVAKRLSVLVSMFEQECRKHLKRR